MKADMVFKVITEIGEVTLLNPSQQQIHDWATVLNVSDTELFLFSVIAELGNSNG